MNLMLQRIFTTMIFMSSAIGLMAQCTDNIVTNSGFEDGMTDWWNWHDNSPDSYTFELSADAFTGDSSLVINVLQDTDLIPGGQGGEYNSRPQTNAVIGGQFYEIKFYAKSTLDNTQIPIYIKDENDGWILLHNDILTVGTDWTEVTSIWQADMDRADIHLEIKVFNDDFHQPYSVYIDDVSICLTEILTNTCSDNIVTNPGFESGIESDWWTWHGGDETDYTFETSTESELGNASAEISILKPSSELTGAAEFNSRPQMSPVVAGQNYRVTAWAKSTVENTTIQMWVKDENDGWTTIGEGEALVGTDWTEATFVFENEQDRDDVHIELKVFNADFDVPYKVLFDEVSICETDDAPGDTGGPTVDPYIYGSTVVTTSCSINLADDFLAEDMQNDGAGWDIWDGSDDEDLSTFELDPILPNSGSESMRIDITEGHDVAEFHHRYGNDITLEDGMDYTVTIWMRSNVPAGDTVRAFTRLVRDTDWTSQFAAEFVSTGNDWLNYSDNFTADGTWDNAFLEMKLYRVTDFSNAYSVWLDDVQICPSGDAMTTDMESVEALGLTLEMMPNPAIANSIVNLNITAQETLQNTNIQVLDIFGRTLWSQQTDIQSGFQNIQIPTTDLSSGMYIININQGVHSKSLKLQVLN